MNGRNARSNNEEMMRKILSAIFAALRENNEYLPGTEFPIARNPEPAGVQPPAKPAPVINITHPI